MRLDSQPFTSEECDPIKNINAIVVIKQPDGNYIGEMQRNGKIVQIRDIGPDTVLQALLTYGG